MFDLRRLRLVLLLLVFVTSGLWFGCNSFTVVRPVPPLSTWLDKICPNPSGSKKRRILKTGERILCQHQNRRGYPRWIFQASERIVSTPKPGIGDMIFISSLDRKLYAIDSQGNRKWTFKTADLVLSSPATTIDGTVYIAAKNGLLYAVNSSGVRKRNWESPFDAVQKIDSSPKIDTNNTIYIPTKIGKFLAINPNKTTKWVYQSNDTFQNSTPEFSTDFQTLYIGGAGGTLHAIRTTHPLFSGMTRHKWRKNLCDKITASPAVGPDGTIYVGCWNGKLLAVSPLGRLKWSFQTGSPILATPRIGEDNTIYVGSDSKWFYAVRRGKCLWRFRSGIYKKGKAPQSDDGGGGGGTQKTNADKCQQQFPPTEGDSKYYVIKGSEAYVQASATISSKKVIYFGSINEYLYAVSRTGKLLWSFDAQGWIDNAPIVKNTNNKEIIYVAAGSRLYAINP